MSEEENGEINVLMYVAGLEGKDVLMSVAGFFTWFIIGIFSYGIGTNINDFKIYDQKIENKSYIAIEYKNKKSIFPINNNLEGVIKSLEW